MNEALLSYPTTTYNLLLFVLFLVCIVLANMNDYFYLYGIICYLINSLKSTKSKLSSGY